MVRGGAGPVAAPSGAALIAPAASHPALTPSQTSSDAADPRVT